MPLIGDKGSFAFEYELFPKEREDEGLWDCLQGRMALYVNGLNVCRHTEGGMSRDFEGILFYVVDWICENLAGIIGFDPYPLPVEGDTILELIDAANGYESDDDLDEFLWFGSEGRWIARHSWMAISEAVIPGVFFRRKGEAIEVAWDSGSWARQGVHFLHPTGSRLVGMAEFMDVMLGFLTDVLETLSLQDNDDAFVIQDWASGLRILAREGAARTALDAIIERCKEALAD